MTKKPSRLTERWIERNHVPGRYGDGRNLYLQVRGELAKSWIFRYRDSAGRDRFHGLGQWPFVTLEQARALALDAARMRINGQDPIAAKRANEARGDLNVESMTFAQALEKVIEARRAEWKGSGSEDQWRQSMSTYVLPKLGEIDVRLITTAHIVTVLGPIWADKLETARRVRNRIEAVLSWSIAMGLAVEPNAARMKGGLDVLLPKHKTIQKKQADKAVKHHAALDHHAAPAFLTDLRQRDGGAARMLELVMLTGVRSANAVFADWSEIDIDSALWTIPAEKMKASRAHTVPLSSQAMALLESLTGKREGLIFKGPGEVPFSENAMLALIRRMGLAGKVTTHGLRATLASWAQDETGFDAETIRAHLAHAVDDGDQTAAAYLRGTLFEKRAKLVQAWSDWLESTPAAANVARLSRKHG